MLEEFFESSDEENLIIPQLQAMVVENDDNDHNEIRVFHPVLGLLHRIQHIRILDYVPNIVRNYNDVDFIMHFRLSREVTYNLIERFETSNIFTSIPDNAGNRKISAEIHVLSYLWFIGHQSAGYRDVADRFNLTISILHKIITRVTDFILLLAPHIICYPNDIEKYETASFYENEKGFPGIIGCIDGTHIRIDKPIDDPDSYLNRKQNHSIHMQGIVNHEMRFIDVFVGYPGSVHDARVFKNSHIRNDLSEICGDNYYLLGDSAYPCLKHLIVPYKDNGHLTQAQKYFNRKLSSCRVHIENAFGILKQRFRQLYHFKLRDIVRMVRIIYACCVLHNIANINDIVYFEAPIDDNQDENEDNDIPVDNFEERENESGVVRRNEICQQLQR